MDDEIKDDEVLEGIEEGMEESEETESHSDYKPINRFDAAAVHHLSGMYQNWFLDYASYTILDRAVPHIEEMPLSVMRSYNWGRKTFLLTLRETGAIF